MTKRASLLPIDTFRLETLQMLKSVRSFQEAWPLYSKVVIDLLGDKPEAEDVFRLGDNLSEIFAAGSQPGRGQSIVSGGGNSWEALVAWYLNLICFGTDVLAVKRRKSNTPQVISDALAVTINNHATSTESDIVVYSVPYSKIGKLTIEDINLIVKNNTGMSSVALVQCKTNWADNAQIPMLWDLIYRSLPGANLSNATVGTEGLRPSSFKNGSVKYAFMTVPTGNSQYKSSSTSVNRVSGLSGGNFWGRPTSKGVAFGFSEFLNRNFGSHFDGSIQNHIARQLELHPNLLHTFLTLDFQPDAARAKPVPPQEQIAPKLFDL